MSPISHLRLALSSPSSHHHLPPPPLPSSSSSSSSASPSTPLPPSSTMQTAIHALAPPHYTPTFSHRSYAPHNHRPVSSINSTPRSAHLSLASSTAPTPALHHAVAQYTQPLPLPLPTPPVRKRKRPPQQVSVYYSEVLEPDDAGRMREVIVIDDTPPPGAIPPTAPYLATAGSSSSSAAYANRGHHVYPHSQASYHLPSASLRYPPPPPSAQSASTLTVSPAFSSSTARTSVRNDWSLSMQPPLYGAPIRTRARAAAEAQQLQFPAGSSSGSSTSYPQQKKRKRDPLGSDLEELAAKKMVTSSGAKYAQSALTHSQWRTGVAPEEEKRHPSWDDKEGHYIIVPGDILNNKYKIVRLLGQGTFGKVVEAINVHSHQKVAVKIIRAIKKYRDASAIEIRALNELKAKDPMNRNQCIHILEKFDHRNHVCIVSELLGMCVYDFLKENGFQPFPRRHIQDFARQLLGSVAFLHELRIVHTDLKPENILLVHNAYETRTYGPTKRNGQPRVRRNLTNTEIRLIDFGSATFEGEYHSAVVSTRHYRAPEIILGLGWDYPCDAFSLGCILVEFYTGVALFQTHDNLEHLAMMEAVMGPMPDYFARKAARHHKEWFKPGLQPRLDWPPPKSTKASRKEVKATKPLEQVLPPKDDLNVCFLDLVRKLLAFDPERRISVRDALRHPYFQLIVPPEDELY